MIDEFVFSNNKVNVKDLIEALMQFDPESPVILGAEGVYQSQPDIIQLTRSDKLADGKTEYVVIWSA